MNIIGYFLLGWIIADFLSGIIHWIEDEFITSSTPLIGKSIGAANELHHQEPTEFLSSTFVERNWTTWAAVIPIALIWLFIAGPSWVLLGAFVGGSLANETHAWTHRTERPPLIRALQASGIFQSAPAHSRHHRGSMNSDYCTLTGWLNPWLELIGFWQRLSSLFGKK